MHKPHGAQLLPHWCWLRVGICAFLSCLVNWASVLLREMLTVGVAFPKDAFAAHAQRVVVKAEQAIFHIGTTSRCVRTCKRACSQHSSFAPLQQAWHLGRDDRGQRHCGPSAAPSSSDASAVDTPASSICLSTLNNAAASRMRLKLMQKACTSCSSAAMLTARVRKALQEHTHQPHQPRLQVLVLCVIRQSGGMAAEQASAAMQAHASATTVQAGACASSTPACLRSS